MEIKNVTVAGSGVLASQIAFQTAYKGFDVVVYDIDENMLERLPQKLESLASKYINEFRAAPDDTGAAIKRIIYTSDLKSAFEYADLLIEAIVEDVEVKTSFYREISTVAPKKTIFATNTSTLPISPMAEASGRPQQFIALHFSNDIAKQNIGEVMGHAQTAPEVFEQLIEFAKQIGMIPLPLHKEHPGYISNSLILPILISALKLWADGVTDVASIDKTFKIAFETNQLPFALIDRAGLNTVWIIANAIAEQTNDAVLKKAANRLQEEFISKGYTGLERGQGFYTYPNPAFMADDFLDF